KRAEWDWNWKNWLIRSARAGRKRQSPWRRARDDRDARLVEELPKLRRASGAVPQGSRRKRIRAGWGEWCRQDDGHKDPYESHTGDVGNRACLWSRFAATLAAAVSADWVRF